MAKWYLDSILDNRVNKSVEKAQVKHKNFLKENSDKLRKIDLQKKLCKQLIKEGKKEEAKKLWHTIQETEKEIYSK